MAGHNGHDNTSNRGDHTGLALIENHEVSQEMAEEQITTEGLPGFEINALLTLHPEERRNIMIVIAKSLGGGSLKEDPQTSSLPLHVNTRNIMNARTMGRPHSSLENIPPQGTVPTQGQPDIVHYASMTNGAFPNQIGGVHPSQAPMGRQVMPNFQRVQNGGQMMSDGRKLPPQVPMVKTRCPRSK